MNFKTILTSMPLLFLGCGCHDGSHEHGHDHDHGHEHDHAHESDEDHDEELSDGHTHAAPHEEVGGVLIELGDHYANLELVPDFETGHLSLYFWDAHAESPARLTAPTLKADITIGSETFPLVLAAQASLLTGETEGDSAHFRAHEARFIDAESFSGTLQQLNLMGESFDGQAFSYPGQ